MELLTPDLAEANFENLTISGQLALIERLVAGEPVTLIGSSLGGYLAGLFASSHPEVTRLVLLAPAFGFLDLWKERLGAVEMARWEHTDQLPVFHYADQTERNLSFQLMRDAARFPLVPDFNQPALILHGKSDQTVPLANSQAFVRDHPNSVLVQLASDHELTNVLQQIWEETARFILNAPLAKSVLG